MEKMVLVWSLEKGWYDHLTLKIWNNSRGNLGLQALFKDCCDNQTRWYMWKQEVIYKAQRTNVSHLFRCEMKADLARKHKCHSGPGPCSTGVKEELFGRKKMPMFIPVIFLFFIVSLLFCSDYNAHIGIEHLENKTNKKLTENKIIVTYNPINQR